MEHGILSIIKAELLQVYEAEVAAAEADDHDDAKLPSINYPRYYLTSTLPQHKQTDRLYTFSFSPFCSSQK